MSAGAIRAGAAFYELNAKDNTDKGLSSAEARLKSFATRVGMVGAAMAGVSAAGLAAFSNAVKAFSDAGDVLGDAMGQTGLGSDTLQTLKFMAADVGVGFEQLRGAITKMQDALASAFDGNGAAIKQIEALGLSVVDLAQMTPDQQFLAIADAISKIPDQSKKAQAALDLLGRAGARLLPAIASGAEGIASTMADLKERKMIMSPEDAKLAAKVDAAFLNLSLSMSRVRELIGAVSRRRSCCWPTRCSTSQTAWCNSSTRIEAWLPAWPSGWASSAGWASH